MHIVIVEDEPIIAQRLKRQIGEILKLTNQSLNGLMILKMPMSI